ncbi:MAG: hypothetical protein HW421_244 [Ignavibacteria bacterium]|nr:hypothetical protein [Ignavibacteria bacterium]
MGNYKIRILNEKAGLRTNNNIITMSSMDDIISKRIMPLYLIKLGLGIIVLLLLITFSSCKTVRTSGCQANTESGNLGGAINSSVDEFSPMLYHDSLFFTSKRIQSFMGNQVYKSVFSPDGLTQAVPDSSLPYDLFPYTENLYLYNAKNSRNGSCYFNIVVYDKKKKNSQIVESQFEDGEWGRTIQLPEEINSKYMEAFPSISPDGSLLVFSSDRPGGTGKEDLYISHKNPDGSWSEAKNPGPQINTPESEITPNIDNSGNLFFASNGYRTNKGYDLMRAAKSSNWKWFKAKVMANEINSEFDEKYPFVNNNTIYFSSNRPGGCGGYDIYSQQISGAVYVEGFIESGENTAKPSGKVVVTDSKDEIFKDVVVGESGYFRFDLPSDSNFNITYTNSCMTDFSVTNKIHTPFSDSTTVKIVLRYSLPEKKVVSASEEFNIPFFVSGYYMPNTQDNLESLRLKFEYNLVGNNDSTRYIENPGEIYDKYCDKVEEGLAEVAKYILDKTESLDRSCAEVSSKMLITVSGFTDTRKIMPKAKYEGFDAIDPDLNIDVLAGELMTNELLCLLRAYYTVRHLQTTLETNENFLLIREKIYWKIAGIGVDENSELSDELKRRVNIKIDVVPDEEAP